MDASDPPTGGRILGINAINDLQPRRTSELLLSMWQERFRWRL
jgi:hypothetical protein